MMESIATDIRTDIDTGEIPNALVLGNGLAASLACVELLGQGFRVCALELPMSRADEFHCPAPEIETDSLSASIKSGMGQVETHVTDNWPAIRRDEDGFSVDVKPLKNRKFEVVFFSGSPGNSSPEFPITEISELYSSLTTDNGQPRDLIFLFDYPDPTDPAFGMSAILSATRNASTGGKSSIIFKNAPVRHLNGETLYDLAKASGVMFYRYADDSLEARKTVSSDHGADRIVVSFQDIIEMGERLELVGDKLFLVTGLNAGAVPATLRSILSLDVDSSGFLISESIHGGSYESFNKGIYCTGGFTGIADLLLMICQAKAAAANARAYVLSRPAAPLRRIQVSDECVRCLTCHRICPHSAIWPNVAPSRSQLEPILGACAECGICVSECPRMALEMTHFPEAAFTGFMDDLKNQRDKIVVYGCSRSAGRCVANLELPSEVIFFSVPCAGRVSQNIILDTIATGVKGLLVIGCHHGNCASNNGTDWACGRVKKTVSDFMAPMGLETALEYKTVAPNEAQKMESMIRQFADSLKNK